MEPAAAAIAACAAEILATPAVRTDIDEAELWRDVARDPDDLGPRNVLADYLVERRDRRGELIAAQLSTQPRAMQRAEHLLAKHWYEWLGDVALVITRRGSEFRGGMLETIHVGMHRRRPWAYGAIRGHRSSARCAPCAHTTWRRRHTPS